MKIQSFLLFLALLSTIQFCQSENAYEKFKNQHIIDEINMKKGCEKLIQEKHIQDKSNCKKENTFILSNVDDVISVCTGMPIRDNLYRSTETFHFVLCTLIGDQTSKPCKYKSTEKEEQIMIACNDGKPVHFQDPN